ncbi:MAG TPA: hypothetical protein VH575_02490 [Gemmataceae bacterium]|jgi:hypothetical protein
MAKFTPALVLAVCVASLSAARAGDMAKPLGKWERKAGKSHVTLIVEENRLHVTFVGDNSCTLHADYAATKDGVIYGVVTSIDCDDEEAVKTMFDAPFSCRYRIDEGALIVRDLKCHETDSKDSAWTGSFKAVNPMPSHTAAVPPSPPASSTSMGVGVGQQSEHQNDNGSQTAADDFLEQYYKQSSWPKALQLHPKEQKDKRINDYDFRRRFGFERGWYIGLTH